MLFENPTETALGQFLIQIVVVLCVVRVLGTLLRRLKQPMVIGEILAGICLGPSILGYIPGFTEFFFPASSLAYISLFAQVSLIFFMFFLGMDVDVDLMVSKWRSALPIAGAAIAFPFLAGSLMSLFLYDYNITGEGAAVRQDATAFTLFLGCCFAFTALPVLARILAGAGLVTHQLGIQSLAAAAVDDVLAWCTLALVLSLVNGGSVAAGLAIAVIVAIFLCLLVFVIKPLIAVIHRRLMLAGDELNTTFVFFIFVLLILSSLLAEMIGVHAFFGAFVFGIVQPRAGKFVEDMKPKLELLIVEVFLPLYFANSGLRTRIGALDTGELWGVCILVTVVAAVSSIVPVTLVTRLFNSDWRFCFAVGLLMNTRGLIGLIVINIGLDIGVLSTRIFTILIMMALITTFMTSPLVYFVYIKQISAAETRKHRASMVAVESQLHQPHQDRSVASMLTHIMLAERELEMKEEYPKNILGEIEQHQHSETGLTNRKTKKVGPEFASPDEVLEEDVEAGQPANNNDSDEPAIPPLASPKTGVAPPLQAAHAVQQPRSQQSAVESAAVRKQRLLEMERAKHAVQQSAPAGGSFAQPRPSSLSAPQAVASAPAPSVVTHPSEIEDPFVDAQDESLGSQSSEAPSNNGHLTDSEYFHVAHPNQPNQLP